VLDDGNGGIKNISARIAEETDTDLELTVQTLESLNKKGFIKSSPTPSGIHCFWTFNKFSDYPPEI